MRKTKGSELGYTAGIIDADGCIYLTRDRNGYVQVRVSVSNTKEWLIKWFYFNFGGHISNYKPRAPKDKPIWRWNINARAARDFLKLILPYLKIKRPQAEIAISFPFGKQGAHITEETKALQEANMILMHKYNKRGLGD